ncbi:MAG: EAL domain-containing protein, partial [Actinomycetes bacterium]
LLVLEITESLVQDADSSLSALTALRALGIRLALDDFGTGYSSLTHLSELPIQQLKIDRSFVSQIHDSGRDRAIVGAVAGLARHLDLEVVAEGIEKPETAELLAELGCGLGQGHHFAQSMAAELLPLWVATRRREWAAARSSPPARTQLLRTVR